MQSRALILSAAALFALARPEPATAQILPSPTLYQLGTESRFEYGCFELCECPVLTQLLAGQFELSFVSSDPLFDVYAVSNVRWTLPEAPQPVVIMGSGTYRIGGEFALVHQLTLDLEVDGGASQHFDSGLVPVGASFPDIDISISIHLMPACFDSVMEVRASSLVATSVDTDRRAAVVERVAPNPFRSQTDVVLRLARPALVDVRIYDVAGRVVRSLQSQIAAGTHAISWDGRRDDGPECPSGIYFVAVSVNGRDDLRHRVVKLK